MIVLPIGQSPLDRFSHQSYSQVWVCFWLAGTGEKVEKVGVFADEGLDWWIFYGKVLLFLN